MSKDPKKSTPLSRFDAQWSASDFEVPCTQAAQHNFAWHRDPLEIPGGNAPTTALVCHEADVVVIVPSPNHAAGQSAPASGPAEVERVPGGGCIEGDRRSVQADDGVVQEVLDGDFWLQESLVEHDRDPLHADDGFDWELEVFDPLARQLKPVVLVEMSDIEQRINRHVVDLMLDVDWQAPHEESLLRDIVSASGNMHATVLRLKELIGIDGVGFAELEVCWHLRERWLEIPWDRVVYRSSDTYKCTPPAPLSWASCLRLIRAFSDTVPCVEELMVNLTRMHCDWLQTLEYISARYTTLRHDLEGELPSKWFALFCEEQWSNVPGGCDVSAWSHCERDLWGL